MEISDEVVSSIDEDLKAEGEEYVKQKYMEHFAAPDQKVSKKKHSLFGNKIGSFLSEAKHIQWNVV